MRYCKKCILLESHEAIQFDEAGVCNICRQSEAKHAEIDWDERAAMLDNIINIV
jgi:hypothetical protein